MMRPKVLFTDLRADHRRNMLDKVEALMVGAGVEDRIKKGDLVAIKVHFGELGNTAYIRPVYVRRAVEIIKRLGAKPFVTDANTLYVGTRSDSVSHLETAHAHGFGYSCLGAPLIIADGLKGKSETLVAVDGVHFKSVHIASEIAAADAIIALTHFKGHELSGFGGAIKNLGMGCAARSGKLAQHSSVSPKVTKKKCIACGDCVSHCAARAIDLGEKAEIVPARCVGCGECILVCPTSAIQVQWNEGPKSMQEKMAEYAAGALKGKEDKSVFVNFLTQVSPACDCYGHSDAPIVADIGVLASTDPVAADQASVDLVNARPGNIESQLKSNHAPGEDKIRGVYPEIDWSVQLDRAAMMGVGSREYDLVKI